MDIKLIKCDKCKTIYKINKIEAGEYSYNMYTDFNDKFVCSYDDLNSTKCVNCKHEIDLKKDSINTEDWIADLFYKVKGN